MGDDVVIYSDCRDDPENYEECWDSEWDIYMKDITTGEETQLTDLAGPETAEAVWESRIYFIKSDLEEILSIFEISL